MTTQHSSYFRILTVWLVLIAFACSMIMPSFAIAKYELSDGAEGDPEDGLDFAGGSGSLGGDNGKSLSQNIDPDLDPCSFVFDSYPYHNFFLTIPLFNQDQIPFILLDEIPWKAEQ